MLAASSPLQLLALAPAKSKKKSCQYQDVDQTAPRRKKIVADETNCGTKTSNDIRR
jgi:hypothetical protein